MELLEHGLREAGIEVRRFERSSAEIDGSLTRRAITGLSLPYRPGAGGIRHILNEWGPSIVHFHNIWPLLTPSALRAARQSGAAVILTAHNYRFACPGGMLLRGGAVHDDCIEGSSFRCGLRGSRENRFESLAYGVALEVQRRFGMLSRWVDALVAPSSFMAEMLVRSGLPRERVHIIPHALPGLSRPISHEQQCVLFFGRLAPEKGVRTLLAASCLSPDVPIMLAGDGPLAAEVSLAAKISGVGGNICYAGQLARVDITEALRKAAFTVVPSECHDNFPFSALESLAAGRAVVATHMGGLPELIDDGVTGLLVPSHDPPALAAAIAELWDDGVRCAEMGRQAGEVAKGRFALERQITQLVNLYTVLTRRRSG